MSTLHAQNARQILLTAMSAEYGVQILVHAPEGDVVTASIRARQTLYRFKNEDADFKSLHIRLHPDDPTNRLWIIRGHLVSEPDPGDPDAPEPKSARPIEIDY